MSLKKLLIFVEGVHDERFFDKIIKPEIKDNYDEIKCIKYARNPKKIFKNYLNSIKAINANYLFIQDINSVPCVTLKKEKIADKFNNIDKNRIVIVIKEIESWYLSGLTDNDSKKFTKRKFRNTDNITKEIFNNLIPQNDSRINFMIEILKCFSIDIARKKNKSFKYFAEKYM